MAKKKKTRKKATKKSIVKRKATKRKSVKRRVTKRKVAKKVVRRKTAKKAAKKKAPAKKKIAGNAVGVVTHYFPHVQAAVVKIKKPLAVGDNIKVKGHTTDFTQQIASLQIDRVPITVAKKGDEVGLLVVSRVRQHDIVYKV